MLFGSLDTEKLEERAWVRASMMDLRKQQEFKSLICHDKCM